MHLMLGELGNCLLEMKEPRSLCSTHDQEQHRAGKEEDTRLGDEALWGWQDEMTVSEQAAN